MGAFQRILLLAVATAALAAVQLFVFPASALAAILGLVLLWLTASVLLFRPQGGAAPQRADTTALAHLARGELAPAAAGRDPELAALAQSLQQLVAALRALGSGK
ncbi:MAG: hypothetical protein HZC24_06030, partial [Rhodocyclales bacterium]|nr:hypothetical protein [Rhodocyclales bacterium]